MRGKRNRFWCLGYANRNIPAYAGKTPSSPPRNAAMTEHPRVCGENNAFTYSAWARRGTSPRMRGKPPESITSAADRGTSPRMRGKPELTRRMTRTLRNIPAYAGKTQPSGRAHRSHQEHPRVCGENQLLFWPGAKAHGTSPRMRGKRPSKIFFRFRYRNIPAYAGKTGALRIVVKRWKEHPRVCGENSSVFTEGFSSAGTSPRMRGKPP